MSGSSPDEPMRNIEPRGVSAVRSDAIPAFKQRNGDGPWREVFASGPDFRAVLLRLSPGTYLSPHRHRGNEVFVIHEGEAEFDFGGGRVEKAAPGAVLLAAEDQRHAIRVLGDQPLLLMCFLAPNNTPDDVVTCED